MKFKIALAILFMPSLALARGGIDLIPNPKAILSSTNTWTGSQTFTSSTTFLGPITVPSCTGCGGGVGTSQNYPDWTITGSQTVNSPTSNAISIAELNVAGDVYILNLYTEPQ